MRAATSLKDQLDATFSRINNISAAEVELRADFSRYLCVLVSGFIEQWFRNSVADFAEKRSNKVISNYVVKATSRISNLNSNKLRDNLLAFNPSWEGAIDALLVDEAKDAIDSVITLRHNIAHGKPADITYERVSRYYKEVVKVTSAIEQIMKNEPIPRTP